MTVDESKVFIKSHNTKEKQGNMGRPGFKPPLGTENSFNMIFSNFGRSKSNNKKDTTFLKIFGTPIEIPKCWIELGEHHSSTAKGSEGKKSQNYQNVNS